MTLPTVGAINCDVFDHGGRLSTARIQVDRFAQPAVEGYGTISGPRRQVELPVLTFHQVADRAAALALVKAAGLLIDTFVSVNPTGAVADVITNVKVEEAMTTFVAAVGLTGTNTYLVTTRWRFLLPVTWLD